jgi:beta-galactosidase
VTEIKVYSNAAQVTVVVNGVSLGPKADPGEDRIFRWPAVTLSPGENKVVATANFGPEVLSDSCVWTLKAR